MLLQASQAAAELRAANMGAKEAVYMALRQRADAETSARAAEKRSALDWVRAPLEPGHLQLARSLLASLSKALGDLDALLNAPEGASLSPPLSPGPCYRGIARAQLCEMLIRPLLQ